MITVEQILETEAYQQMDKIKKMLITRSVNRKKIEHAFNVYSKTNQMPTGLDKDTQAIVKELNLKNQ